MILTSNLWKQRFVTKNVFPSINLLQQSSFLSFTPFHKDIHFSMKLNKHNLNAYDRNSIFPCKSTWIHANLNARPTSSESILRSNIEIELIPCLRDNYAYALVDKKNNTCAVIDPSESQPIVDFVSDKGLKIDFILNTHHHYDHTGGNMELKKRFGAQIVGPRADMDRIPGIDVALGEQDTWQFSGHEMKILDTPGHTRGHVTFYFRSLNAAFTGDTLFSLGCGRLFEGTAEQMWESLCKITSLPPQTNVYCGHEYTQSNARFAATLEPNNSDLQKKFEVIKKLREKNLPTIPVSLSEELQTNPFLRPSSKEIIQNLKLPTNCSELEAFAAIRKAKDLF